MISGTGLLAALRRYWGYDSFRPLQQSIVGSLLEGHDTCVVMRRILEGGMVVMANAERVQIKTKMFLFVVLFVDSPVAEPRTLDTLPVPRQRASLLEELLHPVTGLIIRVLRFQERRIGVKRPRGLMNFSASFHSARSRSCINC